jgi:hypothetical protein
MNRRSHISTTTRIFSPDTARAMEISGQQMRHAGHNSFSGLIPIGNDGASPSNTADFSA